MQNDDVTPCYDVCLIQDIAVNDGGDDETVDGTNKTVHDTALQLAKIRVQFDADDGGEGEGRGGGGEERGAEEKWTETRSDVKQTQRVRLVREMLGKEE